MRYEWNVYPVREWLTSLEAVLNQMDADEWEIFQVLPGPVVIARRPVQAVGSDVDSGTKGAAVTGALANAPVTVPSAASQPGLKQDTRPRTRTRADGPVPPQETPPAAARPVKSRSEGKRQPSAYADPAAPGPEAPAVSPSPASARNV